MKPREYQWEPREIRENTEGRLGNIKGRLENTKGTIERPMGISWDAMGTPRDMVRFTWRLSQKSWCVQLLEILAGTHKVVIFQKLVRSGMHELVRSACSKKGGAFLGIQH